MLSPGLGRRRFLATAGLAVAGAIVGTPAAKRGVNAQRAGGTLVRDTGAARIYRIADGIYATIARDGRGTLMSNGGVIVGKTGAVIIEGHADPQGAALEIELARERSRAPIMAAVNTHYHFDHTLGNSRYVAEKIPILAHELTPAKIRQIYAPMKSRSVEMLLQDFKRTLDPPRTEVERVRAAGDTAAYTLTVTTVHAAALAYPTESVAERRTIDLGGITVILEPRPAHSPTDLLITVPERGVMFTGDLIVNGCYPVTVDADLQAWRAQLVEFSRIASDTVFVPGRGPLAGGDVVARQLDIFDGLAAYAERMFRAGVPLREAQRRYELPARFASLEMFGWVFSISPAITKHYVALAGKSESRTSKPGHRSKYSNRDDV